MVNVKLISVRVPLDYERDYVIQPDADVRGFEVWHRPTLRRLQWLSSEYLARLYVKRMAQADARRDARVRAQAEG